MVVYPGRTVVVSCRRPTGKRYPSSMVLTGMLRPAASNESRIFCAWAGACDPHPTTYQKKSRDEEASCRVLEEPKGKSFVTLVLYSENQNKSTHATKTLPCRIDFIPLETFPNDEVRGHELSVPWSLDPSSKLLIDGLIEPRISKEEGEYIEVYPLSRIPSWFGSNSGWRNADGMY